MNENAVPAQLWVGSHETLQSSAITHLQSFFCAQKCGVCSNCTKIRLQQHHGVIWLTPDKQYTIDQLDIIFETIIFALDPGQHCFFIIQHADALTPLCANALLKSLEEPPRGYHFILFTHNTDRILPTIRSRCLIQQHGPIAHAQEEAFLQHFIDHTINAQQFSQDLEKLKPTERMCMEWLDTLYVMWSNKFKLALEKQDLNVKKRSTHVLMVLKKAYRRPPMPGSAKMFLKNLFLQIQQR